MLVKEGEGAAVCWQKKEAIEMLIEDLYRGKISPYSTITVKNSAARDRLEAAQEEILAALPEEKRSLIDGSQDAYMELVMDEGEAAFAEGVAFGIRLMMEVLFSSAEVRGGMGA